MPRVSASHQSRQGSSTFLKRWVTWMLVLTMAGWLAACKRARAPDQPPPTATSSFGGSDSCRNCHQEEFKLWAGSHHALAERSIEPALERQAFEPTRTISHGSQTSSVSWNLERPQVKTRGLSGSNETFVALRVIGHKPLRQFLIGTADGRLQTLEVAYDPRSNEWFNVYGEEDRQPGEWGHWTGRGMNWNSMCAGCHNTGLSKNYDESTDTYHTSMAEMAVGCEACHGPLQAHNDWQKQSGRSGHKDPTVKRFTPRQTLENCGACHARRADITGQFRPGEAFYDHFQLVTVDDTETFHADGQIRDEDYEFAPFLGSRMHARGVTCGDCHDSHSMKLRLPGNFLCLRCHDGSTTNAPKINPVTHSFHNVFGYDANGILTNTDLASYQSTHTKESGGECVNCHMPQTSFMQRHWRHDHGFTIPDPLLTKEFNIPNACNRCHADKSTDWSLEFVGKWYGDKMNRQSRIRARIFAQARSKDSASVAGLVQILEHEEIPYWRASAAHLLAAWPSKTNVSAALMRGLHDTNALVREACVRSLQPMVAAGFPDIENACRQRLNDPARNVRLAAAWSLRASLDTNTPAGRDLMCMLELNADQPAGQMQLSTFNLSRNNPQQALKHLQKAVEWDGCSPALRQELAVLLSLLGKPHEAVAQLEEAIRRSPGDAESHYRLALACNEIGDIQRAAAELAATVCLAPQHARAWYNLGLAQNSLGESGPAINSLVHAESIDPGDAMISYARATILARLGRVDEARIAAQRALELQPQFQEAHNFLRSLNLR